MSYAPGCIDGPSSNPATNVSIACKTAVGFPDAVDAATGAAVAIVVVGLCSDNCPSPADHGIHESEGHDRVNITLPGQQEVLIQVGRSGSGWCVCASLVVNRASRQCDAHVDCATVQFALCKHDCFLCCTAGYRCDGNSRNRGPRPRGSSCCRVDKGKRPCHPGCSLSWRAWRRRE